MSHSVFPGSLCKTFLTPLNLEPQELFLIITALGQSSLRTCGRWRQGGGGGGTREERGVVMRRRELYKGAI